jgi:hypothetical protein
MLKYFVILTLLVPAHTHAETTENILQFILDDYQAECVSAQQESMEAASESEDLSAVKITLDESSIYNIDITADGKEATVLYANPRCPQIGSGWCGSSGCTSYVIVDGISFQTEGFKPVSVAINEDSVVVIVPRSGGACVNTNDQTPPNNVSCYSVAVWDDYSQTFNSIGSGEPVFKLSEFNP